MGSGYPDFEGNKSELYLVAEWAAKEATDKDFFGSAVNKAPAVVIVMIDQIVPAGKTWYITQVGLRCYSAACNVGFILSDNTTPAWKLVGGGAQAGVVPLSKPIVFPAGHRMLLTGVHFHAANQNLDANIGGYEL